MCEYQLSSLSSARRWLTFRDLAHFKERLCLCNLGIKLFLALLGLSDLLCGRHLQVTVQGHVHPDGLPEQSSLPIHSEGLFLSFLAHSSEIDHCNSQVFPACEDLTNPFALDVLDFFTCQVQIESLIDHLQR